MSIFEAELLDIDLDNSDHHLTLTDGTNWFVNPRDLPIVAEWVPSCKIAVDCCEDNSFFPYKLTNREANISILAMKID
jgi:hypothetical protein